jgi:uncharacterized membrane protein YjjP (DUF1212 family)
MNEMKRDELAMEVVLTAGKLMIESGADMARVDDISACKKCRNQRAAHF